MFSSDLGKKLDKYHLLKHPFYQIYWNEGKLNREIIKDYAEQYYQHVKAFPRYISATHSICEDIEKICPEAFVFSYSNPMQRICHALTTRFPNLKIIGLCHEVKSMDRQLPTLLETPLENIEFEAGGLNHFSILLKVNYKDTGKDGYPIIREKFNDYYSTLVNDHEGFISKPGAERGVFFELFMDSVIGVT
mgnify:CR=1 FL=1